MQTSVYVTYKCNAGCEMCNIWKHPSRTAQEFKPHHLLSLPNDQRLIVISGGEPTLRKDLDEIVYVLRKKARRIQIVSNGTQPEILIGLARRFGDLSFRLSIDGIGIMNDEIRGLKGGFARCIDTIQRLRTLGVRDLGISMTVWDRNATDLLPLYEKSLSLDVEFAQSAPHNSHHFHKHDNEIGDVGKWEIHLATLVRRLLTSKRQSLRGRAKDWVRAYMSYGYIVHARSRERILPCRAATDFCTIDPFGNVLPCNGMDQAMPLGNLTEKSFPAIWESETAARVRGVVKGCENCWMICNAGPSIRNHPAKVATWIVRNKIRAHFDQSRTVGTAMMPEAASRKS